MTDTEFDKVWPWIVIAMVTVLLAFGLGISVGTAIAWRKASEAQAMPSRYIGTTNETVPGRMIINGSPDRIDLFITNGDITIKAKP